MNPNLTDLLRIFNDHNVEYLLIGGYAVIEYTEPRYTKDLDVWVRAHPANAEKVFKAVVAFGAPTDDITPEDFATEGTVFQIGVAPVRIDILMTIDGVTFSEAWPNRTETQIDGVNVISYWQGRFDSGQRSRWSPARFN